MPSIQSTGWTSDRGVIWRWVFEYTTTINKLSASVSWGVYLRTSKSDTQEVACACSGSVNGTAFSATRTRRSQNVRVANGSFTKSLNSSTGTNTFSLSLTGSIYSGSNNCNISSQSVTISGGWSDPSSLPTISITDNGNNSFTLSGKTSSNALNNGLTSAIVYYTTTGQTTSTNPITFSLSVGANVSWSRTISLPSSTPLTANNVHAKIVCTHAKASYSSSESSKTVKFYTSPTISGAPILTSSTSKMSLRSILLWTWRAAVAGNTYSPVAGYRLSMYKNGVVMSGIDPSSTAMTFLDTESTSISYVISNLLKQALTSGDKITLSVTPYAKNGINEKIFSSQTIRSIEYVIQNSGIIRLKVNGQWVEGQVYIKVNGSWIEAKSVYVKVNNSWKESV